MSTLAQLANGDLDFSSGNLLVVRDASSVLVSKITARYRMFLGEWFLDTRQGVPYFQTILVKNPNIGIVRSVLRSVLEQTEGIASIDQFDINYNPTKRTAGFTFRVTTDTNAVIAGGSGLPFVITEPPT